MNNNVNVDPESLKIFRNLAEKSFNNIITSISTMYDKSVENIDMINSKTGNLYKEVMFEQLTNEKNSLIKDSENLLSTIDGIYEIYKKVQDSNSKSVGDTSE